MKKFWCMILAVIMCMSITCTQAFGASTTSEYDAIIDAVNKACYTSGTPGTAESTGIMGADTTEGTVAFNGDLDRLTNDVTWTLTDGVLTVSGSGSMMQGSSYRVGNKYERVNPFVGNEHIETIVLDENLADICGATFSGIPNLKTIIIMDASPYMTAFYDNSNLETIIVGANLVDNPIENTYTVAKLAMTMPISANPRVAAFVDTDVDIIVLTRGEYKSWGGDDDKFISGIRDWDTAVADAKTAIANANLSESVMSNVPAELGGSGTASENQTERINAFMPPHRVCYSKAVTHFAILDSSFAAWQNWPYSHTAVRNSILRKRKILG